MKTYNYDIEAEVLRLVEVTPTGEPLEHGYWGAAAYSRDSGIVRAAENLDQLRELAGDLEDPVALFRLVQREYPLGNLDGTRMTNDELDQWAASCQPLPDPKPFRPHPDYPTQTELLRIDTFNPKTGRIDDVWYGIAARGPRGDAIARVAPTLDEMSDLVDLDGHEDLWDYVASRQTIGTVTGGFVDPLARSLTQLFGL
jgi:hypothetical protein